MVLYLAAKPAPPDLETPNYYSTPVHHMSLLVEVQQTVQHLPSDAPQHCLGDVVAMCDGIANGAIHQL